MPKQRQLPAPPHPSHQRRHHRSSSPAAGPRGHLPLGPPLQPCAPQPAWRGPLQPRACVRDERGPFQLAMSGQEDRRRHRTGLLECDAAKWIVLQIQASPFRPEAMSPRKSFQSKSFHLTPEPESSAAARQANSATARVAASPAMSDGGNAGGGDATRAGTSSGTGDISASASGSSCTCGSSSTRIQSFVLLSDVVNAC